MVSHDPRIPRTYLDPVRVRTALAWSGWTRKRLARRLRFNVMSLHRWERKLTRAPVDLVEKLEQTLGVPAGYLVGRGDGLLGADVDHQAQAPAILAQDAPAAAGA
jgi:ribosome-binding protein aMBF1 (putative translation factor)